MLCPACQTETLADDGICRSCGLSFSARCPNCQHPNLEAARFCSACGERLDQPQPVGERKVVTVMFADIVGSTELIGDIDPEQALDRLRRRWRAWETRSTSSRAPSCAAWATG